MRVGKPRWARILVITAGIFNDPDEGQGTATLRTCAHVDCEYLCKSLHATHADPIFYKNECKKILEIPTSLIFYKTSIQLRSLFLLLSVTIQSWNQLNAPSHITSALEPFSSRRKIKREPIRSISRNSWGIAALKCPWIFMATCLTVITDISSIW